MGEKWRKAQRRPGRARRLPGRHAGKRSRHRQADERRRAAGRNAFGGRPDRNRSVGCRAPGNPDAVQVAGRGGVRHRQAAPGPGEAAREPRVRRAVLGRQRVGALLLAKSGDASWRLQGHEDLRDGIRQRRADANHAGARLHAGAARCRRCPHPAADRRRRRRADVASHGAGRPVFHRHQAHARPELVAPGRRYGRDSTVVERRAPRAPRSAPPDRRRDRRSDSSGEPPGERTGRGDPEDLRSGLQVHAVTPQLEDEWRRFAEGIYPRLRGSMVPADMFDRARQRVAEYRSAHP